jgi:hypothetical protein
VVTGIVDVVEGVVVTVIDERRADLQAYRFATTTPTSALVTFPREAFSPRLVALLADETERAAVLASARRSVVQ